MNRITLIGRLTADPDMRSTQNGTQVCTFTLAVDRRFADQNGERATDFLPVVAWRKTAEVCGKYLLKGQKAAVSGTLQTRRYEDRQGNKRTAYEVVAEDVEFLEKKAEKSEKTDELSGFEEMADAALPF